MSADSLKRFLILSVGAVYLASVPWAYRDAERRGQSGPLVALVVGLVSWPFGLLAWLFTRPAPWVRPEVRLAPRAGRLRPGDSSHPPRP